MNSLKFFRSFLTACEPAPTREPSFSIRPSGSQSICTVTRLVVSLSLWKVTTPACSVSPPVLVQATRSSGCCSVITASNSRFWPPTLIFQCVWVSSIWVIDSTSSRNLGKLSN